MRGRAGEDFGFPYCHAGTIADPEFGATASVQRVRAAGAERSVPHVAALGMRFYTGTQFPAAYRNQIFIAEHGSWNRSSKVGYRVTVVTLDASGKAVDYEPFAEGWLQGERAWGRPADVRRRAATDRCSCRTTRPGAIYRIRYRGVIGARDRAPRTAEVLAGRRPANLR